MAQLRAELVPRRNGRSGFNTVFSAKMVSTRCCRPKWFEHGVVGQNGFQTVLSVKVVSTRFCVSRRIPPQWRSSAPSWCETIQREREIFIDNLLVRVHLILEMSRPALRHGSLNSLFQVALYLPS